MNIAILIPELGGGGAERVAQILGNYYVKHNNKVYYFLADSTVKQDYPVEGKIIKTNIHSCLCNTSNDLQRICKLFQESFKMRLLKKQFKIDVAISFMEEFNYLNVLSKGKEKVIVRICTILSPRKDLKGLLYKKSVVHFFYSKADKIIVMSQYAINDMKYQYKIPLNKMVKIPNPVENLVEREKEELWTYGDKVVVCMGRLEPIKQQERIIRAFSIVCKKYFDAKLIILGKGYQQGYLKSICKKLNIEDFVVFVGFTEKVNYYLEHARVFVMASKVEGFPNSMVEAMKCGVPIITTDTPGACGEIIGKPKSFVKSDSMMLCKYGILTPNMPEQKQFLNSELIQQEIILGNAMLKVLEEKDIYKKYKIQSIKRAKMFSINRVMKKWNDIIGNK